MKTLEIAYITYDIYPNIKLDDVIKIAINALAKEEIKVTESKIDQTIFEKVDDFTYNIYFNYFELESFVGDPKYANTSSISIIKIPYKDNQYFLMHLYDYESNFLNKYEHIKNKSDFTYSCEFELQIELGSFSNAYYMSYLKDSGEPEENSLTHYLLKNYFIDWKVKCIRDFISGKYCEATQFNQRYVVELEHQKFIDSYDNVIYDK